MLLPRVLSSAILESITTHRHTTQSVNNADYADYDGRQNGRGSQENPWSQEMHLKAVLKPGGNSMSFSWPFVIGSLKIY